MLEESEHARYIILGTIDGILAVLGIIVGLWSASVGPDVIIKAALGGGIALCLTNGIGSYLAETTVEYGKLSEVEQALLQDLKNTKIERQTRNKILIDSVIHGGSSFVGSLIPLAPFLFISNGMAEYVSIGLALCALVLLGLFSGRISGQSYLKSVVRMVLLGAVVVIACSVLRLGP
jgi:predicted membrane protein (TIGR00267 family)